MLESITIDNVITYSGNEYSDHHIYFVSKLDRNEAFIKLNPIRIKIKETNDTYNSRFLWIVNHEPYIEGNGCINIDDIWSVNKSPNIKNSFLKFREEFNKLSNNEIFSIELVFKHIQKKKYVLTILDHIKIVNKGYVVHKLIDIICYRIARIISNIPKYELLFIKKGILWDKMIDILDKDSLKYVKNAIHALNYPQFNKLLYNDENYFIKKS